MGTESGRTSRISRPFFMVTTIAAKTVRAGQHPGGDGMRRSVDRPRAGERIPQSGVAIKPPIKSATLSFLLRLEKRKNVCGTGIVAVLRFRMLYKASRRKAARSSDVVSGNAENKQALSEAEGDTKERHAPDRAFADKLARRSPPNKVERTAINKAVKRTRARAPCAEMRIEDHGGTRRMYPYHSDEDGKSVPPR
jgi:hypothetical protein